MAVNERPKPLVLIDSTPLRAGSGLRGIGRYVRDLLYGLDACQSAWQDELRIAALYELGFPKRWAVTEDLPRAADTAFEARGTAGDMLQHARRALVNHAATREGAALLHVTEPLGTPLSNRVPRLVTCHDLIPLRYWRQYLGGRVGFAARLLRDKVRYRSAARVVCISRRTADDLRELIGVPEDRIEIVLHGIDLESFHAQADAAVDARLLSDLGLNARRYVLYVGAADWRKNVSGMLDALMLARRDADIVLAWAGKLRPKDVKRVMHAATEAGVAAAIRLLGFVPETHMPALYRGAVAHLFMSRLEGFGLSVVEAMAVGCPVIVARGSASDEVAGDAGIVVDPDDTAAASQAILRMLNNPTARAELAACGLSQARNFDRVRMSRDYAKLYARLTRSVTTARSA